MSSDGSVTGDSGMVRVMGMVVLSLIGIAVSIGLVANILGTANDDEATDPVLRNALVARLEPIGRVRTSLDDLPAVAEAEGGMVVAAAPGPAKTGEELVQGACANCHQAGVAGAPVLGDADAWAERRELGYDHLVASVINGLNAMPARGGSTYTDEEIGRAVAHIAMFPEDEVPAAAPEAPEGEAATAPAAGDGVEIPETAAEAEAIPAEEAVTDPSAVAAADGADPVGAASTDPENESMAASDVGEQANDMVPDDSAAMAGGDTNDMRADEASEGVVTARDADVAPGVQPVDDKPGVLTDDTVDVPVETDRDARALNEAEALADEALVREVEDEVAPADDVPLVVGGPEPEGLSDEVRAAVDGVCAGCHIAGVANAPKIGDVDAWQERADKGLAALTQSVIDGMGAMPARGGSTLADEQVPSAIRYLMSKTR